MDLKNLLRSPLHCLHKARLEGKITTKLITEKTIERIQAFDLKVKAFLSYNFSEALTQAEKADEKIKKGQEVDLIEGMPLAIKDIFNVQGTKTTCGSKILENYISPFESTATQLLKNRRYGLIGKTNMDEFAMGSSTEKSAFQVTKNPWNENAVPGGSSGGSAAAVAADFCVAALGTDTGGSIRQPAGFCGVVGLKPTYGRVSRYGMVAFASSLDQGGPMTRDVKDAALLLERISGYDPKDPTSAHLPPFPFQPFLEKGVKGLKIGVVEDLSLKDCSLEIQENYHANLSLFEKNGGILKKISISNLKHATAIYYVIATAEASSNLGRYDGVRYGFRQDAEKLTALYEKTRAAGFGEEVKLRILLGTFVLSAGYYEAYYGKAKKVRALLQKEFQEVFGQVDALAFPIAPTTAFPIGQMLDDPMAMYLTDVFTLPANLAGLPGISIPSGFGQKNLPIGFQLIAKPFAEQTLIDFGQWFEQNLPQTARPVPFFEK